MNAWKPPHLACARTGALVSLANRAIAPREPGVVDITYLGQSGADAAAMNDALRIFEARAGPPMRAIRHTRLIGL
jgi:hypothetical protein